MAIPDNITKEHILKAISKIDSEGIPNDANSQYYDVLYNDMRYPPKLVISYANFYANGEILDRNFFNGGLGTQCFKILKENGFVIVNKIEINNMGPNIWIEKTLVEDRKDRLSGNRALGKAIWSPQKSANGADIYKNLLLVQEGDIVLHLIDNKEISGVSVVKEKAIETTGLGGTDWDGPAYLIELYNYTKLNPPINRKELLSEEYKTTLLEINDKSEVFYNIRLDLRQGAYLTPCPIELYVLINDIYYNLSKNNLPFYENIYLENNNIISNNNNMIYEINEALNSEAIRNYLNEQDFHFLKGQEKLSELENYVEPSPDFFKELLQKFTSTKITYTEFILKFDKNSEEYKILILIAKLVSYCDQNAADKNILNEYLDKRSIAKSFVRQTVWVDNLLNYKISNNNLNVLTSSIKNAITYLKNPNNGLTMLSENHREMVARNLLKIEYNKDAFVVNLIEYFKPYNITPKNSNNLTWIISYILYFSPIAKKLWQEKEEIPIENPINIKSIIEDLKTSGLQLNDKLITRFVASLCTKPFVILTGLSGSGKTKLAQAFAIWICENENQYRLVPVGADWTNREPLLGFPNALEFGKYIKPDNKVLELIIVANRNPSKPYFLILDEMNLSHVERYFADFLSVMETNEKIYLHEGNSDWDGVPPDFQLPKNLFIVGTVNIDETTYMFSPKVLDRANVIEFRVNRDDMEDFLDNNIRLNFGELKKNGASMGGDFLKIACKDLTPNEDAKNLIKKSLIKFFVELKKTGAEFGYRSASEILRFAAVITEIENSWSIEQIIDASIMQKLLPKVHGSRRKLEPVLKTLGKLCLSDGQIFDDYISAKSDVDFTDESKIIYPLSFEKIVRMYHSLIDNGFTSYAEA